MEPSVTYPGLPAIVPSARRFVRGLLAGTPRAGDMELIASELITNSILHTPAGEGGEFTVSVRTESGWARIEVSDAGTGQWHPRPDSRPRMSTGAGLLSSRRWLTSSDTMPQPTARRYWAEVFWT